MDSRKAKILLIGIICGFAIGAGFEYNTLIKINTPVPKERPQEVQFIKTEVKQAENVNQPVTDTFIVTGYCSCEICCGEWANNRPNGIVYGASGRELIPDYSIAVDPSVIPLGSLIMIDGKEYRADDTGSAVQGNKIDIYCATHEQAEAIGQQEKEVRLKED